MEAGCRGAFIYVRLAFLPTKPWRAVTFIRVPLNNGFVSFAAFSIFRMEKNAVEPSVTYELGVIGIVICGGVIT